MNEETKNKANDEIKNKTNEITNNKPEVKKEEGKDSKEKKKPVITAAILGDEQPSEENNSFADKLYDEITSVIGGDNPNQFFCMGLPGTLIDPKQYSYDTDDDEMKPAHVKANESKLADKMFDAAFMSPSSNGRHMSTQYRTALNMLTPKLNGKLFDAKTKLRKVLMTPYPYIFEGDKEDSSNVLTLEQVFYKLYGDYVDAKEKWSQIQLDKMNELRRKYPENTAESNSRINDEYLEWYGVVAESEELKVEEKLGKVLAVFSPGDMEIITGILESGSGRELTEARRALDNVGQLDPNGGYVYPVTFYPQNWFDLLDTSFTPIDLLESPAALSQRLKTLEMQKSNITSNINHFLQVIPDKKYVKDLKDKYDACEKTYKDAFKEYLDGNTKYTLDMFKTVLDIIPANSDIIKDPEKVKECLADTAVAQIFGVDVKEISKIVDSISNAAKGCIEAQQALINSSEDAVSSALDYFEAKQMLQLKNMLEPLKQQLSDINIEIDEQRQKIAMSTAMQARSEEEIQNEIKDKTHVAPNSIPDRFTQVLLDSQFSCVKNQSTKSTHASQSSYGATFFFGGYSSSSSHMDAFEKEVSTNEKMEIQIGMSVAKVEIDREWFDPAIFMLTGDMYNTSSEHIAPSDETSFHDKDKPQDVEKRMDNMNKCIFSCYPTAFVVAKDVTIKFVSEDGISSAFAQSVEDHSASGGGFFIFSGSSSSASSSSSSSSVATSSSKSITVRFTAPQILGYYLEAVTPDRSTPISNNDNENPDYISVFDFIEAFQNMLNDHNEKYNKKLLN